MGAGRKPKHEYKSDDFLNKIEKLANQGMTDSEIAYYIGLTPQTFCEKKSAISEIREVLARARESLNAIVRKKYLSLGLGGVKTKTVTRKKIELRDGVMVDGDIVFETEAELPPNPQALSTWLFHHDPEWRKSVLDGKKLDVNANVQDVIRIKYE